MASRFHSAHGVSLHPVHAVLLASIMPLYLGALLSDLAYGSTYEIQWTNFASWLIVGALIFNGLALLWAIIDMFGPRGRSGRTALLYLLLVAATFVVGFVNALIHAKDGWATMPEAIIFSIIVNVLAVATIWIGFAVRNAGEVR